MKSIAIFTNYLYILIISLAIFKEQKNFIKSLNYSASAFYCLQIYGTIIGSVATFYFSVQDTYNNLIFNIFMQITIVILAIVANRINLLQVINPVNNKSIILNIINYIIFIVFLNHVMQLLFSKLSVEIYCLISLSFVLCNLFTKILLLLINKMDLNHELQLLKNNYEMIDKKHSEIMEVRDFTNDIIKKILSFLEKKDESALIKYVQEELSPIYIGYLYDKATMQQTERIKEPMIKALVSEFLYNLLNNAGKGDICIHLDIMEHPDQIKKNPIAIYDIIKSFLNDAYKELVGLETGKVNIHLYDDAKNFIFSMISSSRLKNTPKVNKTNKNKVFMQDTNIVDLIKLDDSGFLCQRITVSSIK